MEKVMVYGTLKEGFGNHILLKDSVKLGDFITPATFTMYSLGGFPAIELSGNTAVKGEVYEVDDSTFQRLDRLEGYPRFYNRTQIDTDFGKAWVYYIDNVKDSYSGTKMEEGIWT